MKYRKYYFIALLIIVVDQGIKLLVHFNMEMGEFGEIPILGNWFKLHYTLNEGMAFGIKLGHHYGKLALTTFRWIAMFVIGYYLYIFAQREVHPGFLWSIAFILGGAMGNVIDSTFYGVLLDNAPLVEHTIPFYPYFHGQVVDMFYFDVWQGYVPDWMPFFGNSYYSLWPIFNIADASIFLGVSTILAFQKKFFPLEDETESHLTELEVPSENKDANLTL